MRKIDKFSLAKELLKSVKNSPNVAAVTNIVLDGGHLLHRIQWQYNDTYHEIANLYVSYMFLDIMETVLL